MPLRRSLAGGQGQGASPGGNVPSQGPINGKSLLRQGSRFALQMPECIAGGVKAEYLSFDIPVGQRWVGLTANQARVRRGSSNDNPRYPHGGGAREGWKVARGHKLANPGAQFPVIHTS